MVTDKNSEEEIDELLEKIRKLLKAGRTAGRQKFRGGVFFWTFAGERTRESLR
jgi:hypothetical protein